ncbi:heavy metal-responsive transcriptional regulator [Nonomuraea endophytica]|uniref:heavy metal-responsive transcriptional regulator n=1 Tax=Nonomuraea endophytica TaxID=714136 RepID=UPI0037C5E06B
MRIGELADRTGYPPKTIRYYESVGLLPPPPRNSSGYRDFPPETAERLAFIRNAQAAGLTLAAIRTVVDIRDSGQAPCRHVTALIDAHLEQVLQRIAELTATRTTLRALQQRAQATDPADCAPRGICTILAGS